MNFEPRWREPPTCPRVLHRLLTLAAIGASALVQATTLQEDVMLAAARDANVGLFRQMVQSGANPNARDASGNNAVVFSVASDTDAMLREVLSRRIDVNARGGLGMAPLGLAVVRNNGKAVQSLLRAGADPDLADANGVTPLASAVRLRHGDLALTLLEAGADPDRADRDGIVPLHVACETGDIGLMVEMLVRGADPNRLDRESRSPLFVALLSGHAEAAELLIRDRHTNLEQLTQGYSARHWTMAFGQSDLATLIDQRASR